MSIFGKVGLIATLLFLLAGAYLSYDVWNKRKADKSTIEQTTSDLDQTKKDLDVKKKEAAANMELAKKNEEQAKTEAEKAAQTQKQLDEAQKKVTDLGSKVSSVEAAIKAKDEEYEKFKASWNGLTPEQVKAQKEDFERINALLNEEKSMLADTLAKAKSELDALKDREDRRKRGVLPLGTRGKIVSVSPEWNFVVIDIGEADQVVEGAQMLIYRGDIMLGRVKIRTVEKKTSIADIVSLTQAGRGSDKNQLLDVRPGDTVIF